MKELISNKQLHQTAILPNKYTDPELESALRMALPKLSHFFRSLIKNKEASLLLTQRVLEKLWINRNCITASADLDTCIFENAKTEVLAYLCNK